MAFTKNSEQYKKIHKKHVLVTKQLRRKGGFMPSVTLFGQHSHRFGLIYSML